MKLKPNRHAEPATKQQFARSEAEAALHSVKKTDTGVLE